MITVNLDKAKAIAHDMRRIARDAEMAPHDLKATIPAYAEGAEKARQVIREKYAGIQSQIDTARSVEDLTNAIKF